MNFSQDSNPVKLKLTKSFVKRLAGFYHSSEPTSLGLLMITLSTIRGQFNVP